MARTPSPLPSAARRVRGFEATSGLLKDQIRKVGESRGFAVARLLTHWPEIAGEEMARITRPVKVGYGREGMGASLTLLTTGSMAPMVEMQKEKLRERVNAVYGYAAISRILLTQTAATGFAEGQAAFSTKPKAAPVPDPQVQAEAARTAAPIHDEGLRMALEALAQNILTRRKSKEG
ncbi:MAG: hypothetical protein ACD_54C01124G0001 [uncultured bacterium]|uniref:DUF721 domain-containing protein n=1 Tax=Cypionkella sp. TaxID=2811411 RepID=UPI00028593EE|nr:DciA family protein [Cypionkella sp.]EKD59805.1 MAG: hypothetical protein ACD_54C01124G0001 [uncultured bacterium]KAF0175022.1 MAG: Uncharacterized protein FD162_743 [Paracoccaceae bacterium]MDO8325486.1 DciA family protein [Cypionkella sp.]